MHNSIMSRLTRALSVKAGSAQPTDDDVDPVFQLCSTQVGY